MSSPDLDPRDVQRCRAKIRGGSRSFFLASLLLPPAVRDPAYALYAWCRESDDAIDVAGGNAETLAALEERLLRIEAGRELRGATERSFHRVLARYRIPVSIPAALLQGFAWDAQGRRYETLADLEDYGARVAGTVGTMMALVMGSSSTTQLARAAELGLAMQLTNIARDVGEDARLGRIYLPLAWLRDEGIDPDQWIAQPRFVPGLGRVVARVLEAARAHYDGAAPGIARLPAACRPGVMAASLLYAEIGNELSRRGLDSVSRRTRVPARRQLALAGTAAIVAFALSPRGNDASPARAVRFPMRWSSRPAWLRSSRCSIDWNERTLCIRWSAKPDG